MAARAIGIAVGLIAGLTAPRTLDEVHTTALRTSTAGIIGRTGTLKSIRLIALAITCAGRRGHLIARAGQAESRPAIGGAVAVLTSVEITDGRATISMNGVGIGIDIEIADITALAVTISATFTKTNSKICPQFSADLIDPAIAARALAKSGTLPDSLVLRRPAKAALTAIAGGATRPQNSGLVKVFRTRKPHILRDLTAG